MTSDRSTLHWPEYAIEAAALGTFMVSAAVFATALYHPSSRIAVAISNEWLRRALMGLAMGLTAMGIIYSPWGQRSGAHMNPALSLTFFRLGRIGRTDFVGYVIAQFIGGIAGVALCAFALGKLLADPSVHFVVTAPGPEGYTVAFLAEAGMSFTMMTMVLNVSNRPPIARYTGLFAGFLVFCFILFESPLSGFSINPARTFGSAVMAGDYTALWIYFLAPPLGMLLAAEVYGRSMGMQRIICAKLHHPHGSPCIFGCEDRMKAMKAMMMARNQEPRTKD
jgi:aquaporin Z